MPKASIKEPFAALKRCPGRGVGGLEPALVAKKDKGSTDMSAPVSTKKEDREDSSKTDIDPEDTEFKEIVPDVTDVRRWLFPELTEVWR